MGLGFRSSYHEQGRKDHDSQGFKLYSMQGYLNPMPDHRATTDSTSSPSWLARLLSLFWPSPSPVPFSLSHEISEYPPAFAQGLISATLTVVCGILRLETLLVD